MQVVCSVVPPPPPPCYTYMRYGMGQRLINSALQQPVSRTAAACMRASDCRWCSQRSFCYCSWCPWARRTHMRTQSQSLPDRHRAARGDERLIGGGADRGARFAPWRWRLTACRLCLRLHPQNLFFTHSTRINTKPTQFQCNYSFLKEIWFKSIRKKHTYTYIYKHTCMCRPIRGTSYTTERIIYCKYEHSLTHIKYRI